MNIKELKEELYFVKGRNGRWYLLYETDDTKYYLTADDLFRCVDILEEKNKGK